MKMAKIALLIDEQAAKEKRKRSENVFAHYLHEVLGSLGIPYQPLESVYETLDAYDLIIAGLADESDEAITALLNFAERGGTILHVSDTPNLAKRLGYRTESRGPGYGYSNERLRHRKPLRYLKTNGWFNAAAAAWRAETGFLADGSPDGPVLSPLWTGVTVGKGKILHCQADLPYSIVGIQQGTAPITEDGEPAPDGTASIDDGLLKADDSFSLDWKIDRAETETGMKYFSEAYADKWREVLQFELTAAALEKGLMVPFVGRWPAGVNHVATISHDSDFNLAESAEVTLALLKECGIRSTWCMIEPGYSPSLYEKIKKEGHEIAFHYNALEKENGFWSEMEFKRQLEDLKKKAELLTVTSNKNHYTRLEGWGELFEWCERERIALDQSRGPSKKGNIGFLFGTCLPYFPIAWHTEGNRLYDVLEMGFLTQDLDHHALADPSVITPFLDEVERIGGVAHFLFHQLHLLQQPKVAEAFRKLVRAAKERGFEFWTSMDISAWERARREVRITGITAAGEAEALPHPCHTDVTVWVPVADGEEGAEVHAGHLCRKEILAVSQVRSS